MVKREKGARREEGNRTSAIKGRRRKFQFLADSAQCVVPGRGNAVQTCTLKEKHSGEVVALIDGTSVCKPLTNRNKKNRNKEKVGEVEA